MEVLVSKKKANIFFRVHTFSHQNIIAQQNSLQMKPFSPFFIFPPLRCIDVNLFRFPQSHIARSHTDCWCYKCNYGIVCNTQVHLPENLNLLVEANTHLETVLSWLSLPASLQNTTTLWTSPCRPARALQPLLTQYKRAKPFLSAPPLWFLPEPFQIPWSPRLLLLSLVTFNTSFCHRETRRFLLNHCSSHCLPLHIKLQQQRVKFGCSGCISTNFSSSLQETKEDLGCWQSWVKRSICSCLWLFFLVVPI